MKMLEVAGGKLKVSQIALGCMRISKMPIRDVEELIETALEQGINFFDHADIYGGGKSEEVFAKAISGKTGLRERMIIQSKCGIRKGFFDFSKHHILDSVDGSLKRLGTDHLDVLLLHRPDALCEPEEVASAFDTLHSTGKVRRFGVSNMNALQIELLKKYVVHDLVFNQLQFSITNTGMIDSGLTVNMKVENSVDHDGGILDYCRLKDITIQAWSPFQYGFFDGVFLDNDKFPELNEAIDKAAKKYGVKNTAIAVAWISRHPANIQTIVGTTKPRRVKDICESDGIGLTREEWYEIYLTAGNILP